MMTRSYQHCVTRITVEEGNANKDGRSMVTGVVKARDGNAVIYFDGRLTKAKGFMVANLEAKLALEARRYERECVNAG